VKKMKVLSLLMLVLFLSTLNASCKKDKIAVVDTPNSITQLNTPSEQIKKVEVDPKNSTLPAVIENLTEKFSTYSIVKTDTNKRKDGGQTLFILIPPLDLKNLEKLTYITRVKNLIKQLIVIDKRSEFISLFIFDDSETLEKVFLNNQTTDLNVPVHYVARYEAFPEGGVYRNTLTIFPIAPVSNPVILAQTDIIQFNPYEW
jgi:hypothetical protein